jgi:putative oxidoreductase
MARLILRTLVGVLFMGHGLQKLRGWFGGYGIEGTGQFFESIGLRPGKRHATAAGVAETAGGAMLTLGLLTPVSAAALIGTMATAVKTVHMEKGPWVSDGGWEYNAVIIASLVALTETGPGAISLDRKLGTELSGPFWAFAALAAGLGGAAANLANSAPEQQTSAAEARTSDSDGSQTVASPPADVR